jgi:four helix bundle protein
MSRDHRKLRVFELADELAVEVYRATQGFPSEERYGLQSQIRRAAVSTVTNIVEGCARQSTRDYVHFLNMSFASASEARDLLDLSARLGYLTPPAGPHFQTTCLRLLRQLHNLQRALKQSATRAKE